ncbi:MAG: D-tyrosyl-tRNA(Tyr) deacylase [Oceanospirillaceae bacterium]|jgi:D-tyrosyl-tRNA(Tyr) deacylase|uniref:D-aminoacyl-tRNA deacylase n=1 Tax=Marinobacterium litorale TaxID=404770 RepID=UPI0004191A35|nr:D-aminoacyl-tRNA deacylase [Marinobacterium litorale]MBS98161.1 D-tyrosyl-tRNA(Tyr) deacylase [Oceanospirillaceae bacterium]
MKGLIQRVNRASVKVDGEVVGSINRGILLLLGVERDDDEARADKLLHKVANYRIFPDQEGRMNCSLSDIGGELLIVSQFTLVADTRKGMRPGFSKGATPELGEALYNDFVSKADAKLGKVSTGRFGADMKVSLENDGPVTFMIET